MSYIQNYIDGINRRNEKVLSVFLTAGFPVKDSFENLAINALNFGADILEIGIPFSDPLADGPVIQQSSQLAIENGTTTKDVFAFTENIKAKTDKPLIAMTYANILLHYGVGNFLNDAHNAGFSGLIVPDLSLEEYGNFIPSQNSDLEVIMLSTPTTSDSRLMEIDALSQGFVYYVSVTGTTGVRQGFDPDTLEKLKHARTVIKNKLLVGFGISKPEDVKLFANYSDGVIVGSAIIKRLMQDKSEGFRDVLSYISSMKQACRQ